MEGLGVAANVVAVIDLSAKVATLCFQYSKEVFSARADIQRLQAQVEHLGTALRASQRLTEDTKSQSLFTSQELVGSFRDCIAELGRLEHKLSPRTAHTAMRRLGLRALKWPFNSKEVDQLLSSLERHEKTILLGLQIDQTAVLVDIQKRVEQLGLQSADDAPALHKPHRMVPFPPDTDFIHRPAIEEWIQVQYNQPHRRMGLVGMGGFGKSRLAIEFAHNVYASKPGTSVFWVQGNSRATFEKSYRTLADILMLPRRHEPDVNVLALVRDWLQKDDIGSWLMVLDNADDIGVFFPDKISKDPLASYLPKSINGKILVTSRSLDAAEKLVGSGQAILQISVMGEDQALELLQNRLKCRADEAIAIDLVLALDCIPLAVTQAAAYINRRSPRMTVTSYLNEFHKSEQRKDSLLRSDKGDLGRDDGVSNSVVVTWQVTFEQIRREQPRAANLLSLMSQFQAQNIPEYMLHSYSDITPNDESDQESSDIGCLSDGDSVQVEFEDDMDVLRGYCLVTPTTEGLCEMHPLVQFCTRLWIAEFGDSSRWDRLFIHLAADYFPSGDFDTWGACQRLLPHIESIIASRPKRPDDLLNWSEVLTNVSWYMVQIGEYSRSEALGKQAAQTRNRILGPEHVDTLESKATLALTYWHQGQLEQAEKLGAEVLEVQKVKLGADHLDTLFSMANLASTYWKQGRLEEAEKLGAEVLKVQKVKLGADHLDTLLSMANLASTYWKQGRLKEAEKLEAEVLKARKAKLGADHPDTLNSMANLASTYRKQGRLKEAEKLEAEVLKALKVKLGADHLDTLLSMANLALIYWQQGRLKEAEKLEAEVLKARKAKLGADHPDTLNSMANLASTYWHQGRLKEAEMLEAEALKARKAKLGADHPDTLNSMANLATTYWHQERLEETEKLQTEVLEAEKVKLGADHPDTLSSMASLAYIWHRQGRQEEAFTLLQSCVYMRQKKLGHTHPDTQSSVATLGVWKSCSPEGEDN